MELERATVDRVVSMWEGWEQSSCDDFDDFDDFGGVVVTVVDDRHFVRAPARLRPRLDPMPNDLAELVACLGDDVVHVVGECRLAYADAAGLRLPERADVMPVSDDDPRLDALGRSAEPAEWLEASADEPAETRVGIVDGDELVALAGMFVWSETVGHFSVFTRASHRGRGLAGRVVAPLVAQSLEHGLVPQWRSLLSNTPSARVADRLGFVPLGHQMFVRVRQPAV
jgi:predicted GNAT family acetyltransferase